MASPKPITYSGAAYPYIFGDKKKKGGTEGGIFGPKFADLVTNLEDFSTALPLSDFENRASDIWNTTSNNFGNTMQTLNDLLGISIEGSNTGFRQDINDLLPQAHRQYRDFLSDASSTYADSNILSGSDFQRNIAGESSRLSENLTARQFDENVRAAQARGDWTAMAQNLGVLQNTLPSAFAADMSGYGEHRRKSEEEIRGRPFQIFQSMSGQENQVPFFQQGYNPNSASASNLNAISQAVASFNPGNWGGTNPGSPGTGGTVNPSGTWGQD